MLAAGLRVSVGFAFLAAMVAACGGSSGAAVDSDAGSSGGSSSGNSGSSGSSGTSGGSGSGAGSASSSSGSGAGSGSGSGSSSGAAGDGGGASPWQAGNPNGSCTAGIPARGRPADTTTPTTVVGRGTAVSCTFVALQAAVAKGGVITFDCGAAPITIAVTATLDLPTDKSTVIDGSELVTLDGAGAVRILSFNSANFQANENSLTLQHIALRGGKATPTQAIPPAPPPCSQGYDDGEGGALFVRDGNVNIIDAIFTNNQAAMLGPDTGGGAVYVLGSKHGVVIAGSTFTSNTASNAGAVGGLFAELDVYSSLFSNNLAAGNGANNNDPSKCAAMNNGQNEVGSGGNGGALYSDGNSVNVVLCGDEIDDNAAGVGAFGGGLFFTSNNMMGTLTIADTTMKGNSGGSWTNVAGGAVTSAGTAVGVNAKSITITNSMLQGVP